MSSGGCILPQRIRYRQVLYGTPASERVQVSMNSVVANQKHGTSEALPISVSSLTPQYQASASDRPFTCSSD